MTTLNTDDAGLDYRARRVESSRSSTDALIERYRNAPNADRSDPPGALAAPVRGGADSVGGVGLLQGEESQGSLPREDARGLVPGEGGTGLDDDVSGDDRGRHPAGSVGRAIGRAIADVAQGAVEAPRQGIFVGPVKALQSTLDATFALSEWLEERVPLGTIGTATGQTDTADLEKIDLTVLPFMDTLMAEPDSTTGQIVQSISRFLTGFLPARAALGAAGMSRELPKAIASGAVADLLVFAGDEGRVSDLLVNSGVPGFDNAVTQYLASDPEDTEAEGRLKNSLEGLALGGLAEGAFRAVKLARQAQLARRELKASMSPQGQRELEAAEAVELGPPPVREADLSERLGEGEELVRRAPVEASEPSAYARAQAARMRAGESAEEALGAISGRTPEDRVFLNLNRIDEPEDIQRTLKSMMDIEADAINTARGGERVGFKEMEELANSLDISVDELLKRRRGQPMDFAQAIAYRKMLNSSAEQLHDLGVAAARPEATPADLYAFRKALSTHYAIQSEVVDARTATARALASWRITAKGDSERGRLISEMLEGGHTHGIEDVREMARRFSMLDSPEAIARFAKEANAEKPRPLLEYWINSLLSGPKTHVVNMTSTGMFTAWKIPERWMASQVSRALYSGEVAPQEAAALAYGFIQSQRDAVRLSAQALRTGMPTDHLGKVELRQPAITAENLNVSGWAGHAVDFAGEALRIPTRLIMAEDEYAKAVAYRGQLHSLAYRKGVSEGLEGDDLAKRVVEIMDNPPEDIRLAGVDFAREVTFTNELGEAGQAFTKAMNKFPPGRWVLPFIRTPGNLMKQTFYRTPLAPFIGQTRETLKRGARPGATSEERAAAAEAWAKVGLGTTTMLMIADLQQQGLITGSGPADPQLRNAARRQGWQPHSIKIGDRYYAYNRLDPLGMTLGMAADMAEITGQLDDEDSGMLAVAGVAAFAKNLSSKTWLRGINDVLNAMMEPERYGPNWLASFAGSLIPYGSLQRNIESASQPIRGELRTAVGDPLVEDFRDFGAPDPVAEYAARLVNEFRARTPGFSEDLPPRRNLWGEPIDVSSGLGKSFDFISPVYSSLRKPDAVDETILDNRIRIGMPGRTIDGVSLTNEEYSRFVQLAGEPAKAQLDRIVMQKGFQRLSGGEDGMKAEIMKDIVLTYRAAARSKMLAEFPGLRERVIERRIERAQRLTEEGEEESFIESPTMSGEEAAQRTDEILRGFMSERLTQ